MTFIFRKLHWHYIRNNPQSVCFTVLVYFLFTGSLIVSRCFTYWCTNLYLVQARACGQVLNFYCAFILVLVLRKSLTHLRAFGLGHYLPIDHYVYFHKLTGWSIALFSAWHTFAHIGNFWVISKVTSISYLSLLFSPNLGIGWIAGLACISGWLLCLVLVLMLVLSMNFIRRSGNFEVFYYSHKLYILFFVFLCIHAPNCWKWLLIPMTLYLIECVLRTFKTKKDQHGLTYVIEGTLLPSRVIRLLIRKPIYFTFNPGDFVYCMVPSVTGHEWHPFTISSAPEDEFITIHIRAVGEWTNRLYDFFEHSQTMTLKEAFQKLSKVYENNCQIDHASEQSESVQRVLFEHMEAIQSAFTGLSKRTMLLPIPNDCDEHGCNVKKRKSSKSNFVETSNTSPTPDSTTIIEMEEINANTHVESEIPKSKTFSLVQAYQNTKGVQNRAQFLNMPLKIHLDGPYGAPSSNIFQTEHAVLIATGIGVTPFASILQSLVYRHTEKTRNCPNCEHTWTEKVPSQRIMNLRKVDFVWINRDHSSFEWFIEKLADLKKQQLSVCGTNGQEQNFLDIHMYVTAKMNELENKLPIKYKYGDTLNWQSGRPVWNKFFERIRNENRGKVTVYYCGRPDLVPSIRNICGEFNFNFKKEVF
ncbi:NADPH oxidase 5 [Blomia tropicalis]|nr:NADPH oxidase 5 [Blomia tropicalis]